MVVACSVHLEPCRKHSVLLPFAVTGSEIRENLGGYLLIEESPEHGQRDVEEQNLEDHLDLRDQKFLGEKKRRAEVNSCLACSSASGSNTYIILLLSPVHPVSSLRVVRSTVPEAVLDGKLQKAERTLIYCCFSTTTGMLHDRETLTPMHLQTFTMMLP